MAAASSSYCCYMPLNRHCHCRTIPTSLFRSPIHRHAVVSSTRAPNSLSLALNRNAVAKAECRALLESDEYLEIDDSNDGVRSELFVRWFHEAWPYFRAHRGGTFVIVISGEIVASHHLDSVSKACDLLFSINCLVLASGIARFLDFFAIFTILMVVVN